ncbi:MAG: HAD family hydrolase [Planctomycetaceae bacterium]|nr:HAD family hydrolase [Planctomycetaceae bacterium]
MKKKPVLVFLDRDGTVIVNKHYQKDPAETELFPDTIAALARLRATGVTPVLVSNQSGIGRGYLTEDDLAAIHRRMLDLIGDDTIFAGMYHCPHVPEDNCACRKPRPGMLESAARDHGAELADSYIVGDSEADIRVGQAVGATTVLVLTGHGEKTRAIPGLDPDYVATNLSDAAEWIVRRESERA